MMNVKALFRLLAAVSFLIVALGIVRFGFDLWVFLRPDPNGPVEPAGMNYRGLGVIAGGIAMLGIFLLLSRTRRH
jgi:hypothetical protein